jgi:parallel beta-helix repeat protein
VKKFTYIVILLVFSVFLVPLLQIGTVKAQSNTIYIRADGTIEGTDLIQREGNVYTFLGNISVEGTKVDGIIVERDNIVIDGAGYTLQEIGVSESIESRGFNGINLTSRSGVTLKNLRIRGFANSIHFISSSNNTILDNDISDAEWGIILQDSNNNSIIQNNLTRIGENTVTILPNGTIIQGTTPSIYLATSSNNIIIKNYIYTAETGFLFGLSHNNSIIQNSIAGNREGTGIMFIDKVFNYTASNNPFNNPKEDPSEDLIQGNSIGTIISGNNFNGKEVGINSRYSSNCIISGNNIINCKTDGIFLQENQKMSIIGNNFENNTVAIFVGQGASNNTIYSNNFINNQQDIDDIRSVTPFLSNPKNIWDNDSKGNYWSKYNGTDSNGDGIGDTHYIINQENQDNYPLMQPVDITTIPEFSSLTILFAGLSAVLCLSIIFRQRIKKRRKI